MRRETLRLVLPCNNHCVFCAQDGGAPRTGDAGAATASNDETALAPLEARLVALRATGADEITFVGGEPTLSPILPDAIARACAAGFRRVGLQTNGRRLAAPGAAEALARAGLTDVHVSVHGAEAAVHDYHTGVAGSFVELFAGVAAARVAGLTVVTTTVLTRSNFRVIGGLAWLLQLRGVAAWLIAVPRVAGRAATGFDRIVPRLGLALPFALHALDAARKLGVPAWIAGAPLCALGPFAARALAEPDGQRAFGAPCEGCVARSACAGVDQAYLTRFGGDELHAAKLAQPPAAAVFGESEAVLARMFVGPGELATRAMEIAPPPAQVRVSLPVLGKVKPAQHEVTAGTPRRSGEALREIFPDLFDRPGEKVPR